MRRAQWVALGGLVIVVLFWMKTRERPDIFRHWLVLVGLIGFFGVLVFVCIALTVRNVSVTLYEDGVVWTTPTGRTERCRYSDLTIQELRTSAGLCHRIGQPGERHFTISEILEGHDELVAELNQRVSPEARIG